MTTEIMKSIILYEDKSTYSTISISRPSLSFGINNDKLVDHIINLLKENNIKPEIESFNFKKRKLTDLDNTYEIYYNYEYNIFNFIIYKNTYDLIFNNEKIEDLNRDILNCINN